MRAEGAQLKESVAAAIEKGIRSRREVLGQLTVEQRKRLLERLFTDFFGKHSAGPV
jgi:hypothetical protein